MQKKMIRILLSNLKKDTQLMDYLTLREKKTCAGQYFKNLESY